MSESVATTAAPAAPAVTADTNKSVGGPLVAGTPTVDPKAPAKQADAKATDAKAADPKAAEAKANAKMIVDGNEIELTPDLVREFQKQAAADKRLKEAADARKAVDADKAKIDGLVQALKQGDHKALLQAGLSESDVEKLAVEFLSGKVQAQLEVERVKSLDPKEREYEDLKRWKAESDKKVEADKKTAEETAKAAKTEQYVAGVMHDYNSTRQQLPEEYRDNPAVLNLIQQGWGNIYENFEEMVKDGRIRPGPSGTIKDSPDLDHAAVAKDIVEHFRNLYRSTLSKAKGDELAALLTPEVRAAILAEEKAKAEKAAHPALTGQPQVREKKSEEKPPKRKTQAEIMRGLYTHK